MLAQEGVLEASTVDAVQGLRMLRNVAVHAPEPIPAQKAKEFVEMANAVAFAISMNVKRYAARADRPKAAG